MQCVKKDEKDPSKNTEYSDRKHVDQEESLTECVPSVELLRSLITWKIFTKRMDVKLLKPSSDRCRSNKKIKTRFQDLKYL